MQGEEDLTRKMVRGLLTLLLTTLATWLANKITEAILGPEEDDDDFLEEADDFDAVPASA